MTEKRAPKRKPRTCPVWALVDAMGSIYALTVSYSRKDCLAIPHEQGVKCVRATLTLTGGKGKGSARKK